MSDKMAALDTLSRLPDDATYDDIVYALYVRHEIELGLRDVEAGNTVPHEQVMREMRTWLSELRAASSDPSLE